MQDLIQMLNEYEIKNIISVDDNWFVSEGFVAKIVAQGVGKNMSIKNDFIKVFIKCYLMNTFMKLENIQTILRIRPCLHLAFERESCIFQRIINRQSI